MSFHQTTLILSSLSSLLSSFINDQYNVIVDIDFVVVFVVLLVDVVIKHDEPQVALGDALPPPSRAGSTISAGRLMTGGRCVGHHGFHLDLGHQTMTFCMKLPEIDLMIQRKTRTILIKTSCRCFFHNDFIVPFREFTTYLCYLRFCPAYPFGLFNLVEPIGGKTTCPALDLCHMSRV